MKAAVHPRSVSNDKRSGLLEIRWSDGAVQQLDNAFLRSRCRCADCKSGRTAIATPPPGTRITGIEPVGSYGVQLIFDDGHGRGIYPWVYLRSLAAEV